MDAAPSRHTPTTADAALGELLAWLRGAGYQFVTPTPATHERVLARRRNDAAPAKPGLRDIFGWNVTFDLADVPSAVLALLKQAGALAPVGYRYKSTVRVSSLGERLFLHSAFPASAEDAVFFGPDTYRFCAYIRRHVRPAGGLRILDVGCGGGAGGIAAALAGASTAPVTMNDINPLALRYAAINARAAGVAIVPSLGGTLAVVDGDFDLIVANPPYMADPEGRAYRHGGDDLGRALSVRIVQEAVPRLAPGGTLLLYSGVAVVDGVDYLLAELEPVMVAYDLDWEYEELDPDVFGEELARPVYVHTDRIAVVGLRASKRRLAGV